MINKFYILLFCLIPLTDYGQVNYDTDIQPIFNSNCVGCHSGGNPSAGLNLTSLDNVLLGSNNGPVITEGNPFSSTLWQEVSLGSMPPGPNNLDINEVNIIEEWILNLNSQNNDCLVFEEPAQSCVSTNSIAVPSAITTDIEIGDQIGLFYINELGEYTCSSTFIWTGGPGAELLIGCGDDGMTTEIEGFQSGDQLYFFVLRNDGSIYNLDVDITQEVYIPNGLEVISSIFLSDLYASGCGENSEDILGCTDENACNYDSLATDDDSSCVFATGCDTCSGETDGSGTVVDNDADDDDICDADEVAGCQDSTACNYNSSATDDDSSCVFATGCETCSGETDGSGTVVDNDADDDGVCDADEVAGCQDSTACNYNSSATDDDSSCVFATGCDTCSGETDGSGTVVDNDADDDGVCDADEVAGCTDILYLEYDPLATDDNGSCVTIIVNGCTDPFYLEFNPSANVDDGSCLTLILDGCTDESGCNYNPNATDDDGSCTYPDEIYLDCNGDCLNDTDGDGVCDEIEVLGCQDSTACNYNENATDEDNSCIIPVDCETCSDDGLSVVDNDIDGDGVCDADEVAGCQDVTACNYNENATDADNSCIYVIDIYGVDYLDCNGDCVNDTDGDGICNEVEVPGCTDSLYLEFNPLATDDDGSCLTLLLDGCTDSTACNYNPNATDDDDSCTYPDETYLDCNGDCVNDTDGDGVCDELETLGCQDTTACNYDSSATDDDGSCTYPVETYLDCNGDCLNDTDGDGVCDEVEVAGCTDSTACNYDSTATDDDSSCTYPTETYLDCNGDCLNDTDGDGVCDELEILGCNDVTACNYDTTATDDDGSCTYPVETYLDCNGDCLNDTDGDGVCDELEVLGCTDPVYLEFDPLATDDDGSCITIIVLGCTDDTAFNFDPLANVDDNSCLYEGCTDFLACNYDSNASLDDGSCLFVEDIYGVDYVDCNGDCLNDEDGDGVCDEDEVGGCTDPIAYNYDPLANEDDGSCLYQGCTDITACNYDSTADIDDGSCTFPLEDYLDCNGDCLNDTDGDGVCDELEIFGCTDPVADNYNDVATQDDGSCIYFGCTDTTACNYDPVATDDDGSCTYPDETYLDCAGDCLNDVDGDGVCDELEVLGCTDDTACNYDPVATDDDGSCIYAETGFDCDGNCADDDGDGVPDDYDGDGVCDYVDNCFYIFNPGQQDSDGDGEGDACDPDDGIGLDEDLGQNIVIFPNPTNGIVNIEYFNIDNNNVTLNVINAIGQIIKMVELNSVDSYIYYSMDLENYGKGIYQLQLVDSEKVFIERLVID